MKHSVVLDRLLLSVSANWIMSLLGSHLVVLAAIF